MFDFCFFLENAVRLCVRVAVSVITDFVEGEACICLLLYCTCVLLQSYVMVKLNSPYIYVTITLYDGNVTIQYMCITTVICTYVMVKFITPYIYVTITIYDGNVAIH